MLRYLGIFTSILFFVTVHIDGQNQFVKKWQSWPHSHSSFHGEKGIETSRRKGPNKGRNEKGLLEDYRALRDVLIDPTDFSQDLDPGVGLIVKRSREVTLDIPNTAHSKSSICYHFWVTASIVTAAILLCCRKCLVLKKILNHFSASNMNSKSSVLEAPSTSTAVYACIFFLCINSSVESLEHHHSTSGMEDQTGVIEWQVGLALRDLVKQKSGRCNLFLVSTTESPRLFPPLLKWTEERGRTVTSLVLSAEKNSVEVKEFQDNKARAVFRTLMKMVSCWVVVLDLTVYGNLVLRFMDQSLLFYYPKLPLIMVGPEQAVTSLLSHRALRNSGHVTYLSLAQNVVLAIRRRATDNLRNEVVSSESATSDAVSLWTSLLWLFWSDNNVRTGSEGSSSTVRAYSRCLYCKQGNSGVRFHHSWSLRDKLDVEIVTPDEFKSLNGNLQNICTKLRIPFANFDRNWDGPEGTAGPLDSLDVRIVQTAAAKFNFTFLIREPWDGQWGLPDGTGSGNFTGIVGTLQHEKADFSFLLTPIPIRMSVIQSSRVYLSDPFVIISLKPLPLPKSLAIVRPFGEIVWILIIVACFVYGVNYWVFEKIGLNFPHGENIEFIYSIFYAWRILLEDPPVRLPRNFSSQFLIGCWMLGSFIMISAYRCALIAHLTVIKRYKAINAMEDLLGSPSGYTWGRIPLSGASLLFLTENPNPIIKEVASKMEVLPADVHLNRVLEGGYSFVSRKYWALADLLKAEKEGLPVHMSINEFPVSLGYGWGFRKGAPIRDPIDKLKQRLLEAGLINYWMEVIVKDIADNMGKGAGGPTFGSSTALEQGNEQIRVLTLEHLEGSFYLAIIGYFLSLVVLLLERIRYRWFPDISLTM